LFASAEAKTKTNITSAVLSADPKTSAGVRFLPNLKNCATVRKFKKWLIERFFGLFAFLRTRAGLLALVILLCAISPVTAEEVYGESGTSSSYQLDYARFTSDSDRKTSNSYVLLDSVSDIQVEGDSASYQLRNVYSGISAPASICGNGIIETGESCEGSNFQGLTCNSFGFALGALQCVNCQIITSQCFNPGGGSGGGGENTWFCGNGKREAGEQCDDGNIFSGDGCSAGCRIEYPDCGNGIKNIGEECDDGNVNYGDGCTPMCTLEQPGEPEEPEQPEEPIKPSAPELEFEPGFDPSLIYPFLKPQPEKPSKPTEPGEPGQPEEPIKPSAPEHYDYHFEKFEVGQTITILDETIFIATSAPANEFFELVILDKKNNLIVRQGVQSSPEGILMVESIPFLKYKEYSVLIVDTNQEIFKGWNILIEDRQYRIQDNLLVNNEINREFITLGTFKDIEDISGNGKPETDYYAYLQKIEKTKGKVMPISFIQAKADREGNYRIKLPERLKNGSYIMHVVQVYEDGKVSRNKRYIFDIENGKRLPPIWILIIIALAAIFGRFEDIRKYFKKHSNQPRGWQIRSLIWFMSLVTLSTAVIPAQAVQTTPNVFVYEGKLLDNTGTPVTTAQTFRLSLWSSDDMTAGDLDGLGGINAGAPNYGGWFETHTITPNADGTFFLELGSINPLPDMDFSIHKHLMVEVKTAGALDTSYELMDPTGDNGTDSDDRQTIGSTPFTNNADFLDNAEIGTNFGDIVTLDVGDVWNISTIPGGTQADTFTLDYDDTAGPGDTIELSFGNSLNETIGFDITNDWFTFSNDVNLNQNEIKNFAVDNLAIAPASPVTGQVYHNTTDGNTYVWNGTEWNNMTAVGDDDLDTVYINDTDKEMDVLDVRGITFNLDTSGDFLVDLQDTGDFVIADDGTDFAIFTDDGLFGIGNTLPASVLHADSNEANTEPILTLENTDGDFQFFRTDSTPENTVTASVGDLAVDSTNGIAYIKNTGDITNTGWVQFAGAEEKQAVFQVEYANATVEGDGTDNKGLLQSYFADEGGAEKHNYYEWTTRKTTMQDIDVVLSYTLPPDFIGFTGNPLSVLYQTSNILTTISKLDVTLYDTTGTAVTLTGAADLANTAWTTQNITFGGSPTFTAGEVITLVIKLSATDAGYTRVSDVIFNYNGS
jgi:cysteine-rich repeat protein